MPPELPRSPARTTALVSGGKDSIYAAYLAEMQGWPADELLVMEPEDPDSWMFHTPNLGVVDLQGQAWGKPVRREKVAAAGPEGETAALQDALKGSHGPVTVGAIESSFQWARVLRAAEAVSRRVYAPMWRVDPRIVVREELSAGLDVRFARVAAEGLPPEWLGERITLGTIERLEQSATRGRGVHVAGEGGEYETVVLDAPFFSSRVVVDSAETIRRGDQASWVIRRAHLEPKGTRPGPD